MPKKSIVVAYEYKRAFEAICNLIDSGYLDDKRLAVEGSGDNRTISDGTFCYVLGSNNGAGEEDDIFINKSGASWFRSFREQARGVISDDKNQNSVWVKFIEETVRSYHKKFSLVEYRQRKPSKQEIAENEKHIDRYMRNVLDTLFSDLGGYTVQSLPPDSNSEDIYGISLKLEMSGGTGAALPVLAKVYFRYERGKMLPLKSDEAQRVDDYLKEVPAGADDAKKNSDSEDIMNRSLNALEALIKDDKVDFTSVMCFGDKIDEDNVTDMCGKMANGTATLECSKVKVLGISHIKWNRNGADIIVGSRPVLRASIMLGGQLTLTCLACKSCSTLISGNSIEYTDEYGDTVRVVIDPEAEDLGLDENEINDILEKSELAKHLMSPSCTGDGHARAASCDRLVCASEALVIDRGGRDCYLCKDCPYPEIVYKGLDPSGNADYTPDLSYATDVGDFVRTENTEVCTCCGRRFSAGSLEYNDRCVLCSHAGKDVESAHKLYRKYSGMLPPWVRAVNPGKHLCYEDDEILLFVIGNSRYVFNKLDVDENGYLPPPTRLKGRF